MVLKNSIIIFLYLGFRVESPQTYTLGKKYSSIQDSSLKCRVCQIKNFLKRNIAMLLDSKCCFLEISVVFHWKNARKICNNDEKQQQLV